MKKVFMAFAVVAMMAGVSACGNSNSNKAAEEAPAVEIVEEEGCCEEDGCCEEEGCCEETPCEEAAETPAE